MKDGCDEQNQAVAEVDQPIEHNRYSRRMLVHKLSLEGFTGAQIAKKTGFSEATVWRDLQDLGRAEEEILAEQDATAMAVQRVITTLDSVAAMKQSIDNLDTMISVYMTKLLTKDGKIDSKVHSLIMECKDKRERWIKMHEEAMGRIIPAPTLIQNNTTTNQTLVADGSLSPELAAMRMRYLDAKRAGETMEAMGLAEQEGAREHEEGIIDVQAIVQERKAPPSHPDVLP